MQSRLEELGEIGSVKKNSRGTAKKAFTPMDVNNVENPLKNASVDTDDAKLDLLSGHEQAEISQKPPEEDSPMSKKEMIKAKMKEKAAEKAAEGF